MTTNNYKLLEAVAQCELHESRLRQCAVVGAEYRGGLFQLSRILRQGRNVESNSVGYIKYLPAELQALRFRDRPRLAEPAVDSESSPAHAAHCVVPTRRATNSESLPALRLGP